MLFIKKVVPIIAIIVAASCSNNSGKGGANSGSASQALSDDSIFARYLRTALQLSVPDEAHTYVLIAGNGCSGCQMTMALRAQNQKHPNHVSFIFPLSYRQHFEKIPPKVLFDSTGKIARLKFHKGNICIVRTKQGRIVSNTLVEPAIVDTVTID